MNINSHLDPAWVDYVIDSLEIEGDYAGSLTPIANHAEGVIDPHDRESVLRAFTTNFYPYQNRISMKEYYREKLFLQVELVKLQNWVKAENRKIVLIFEGRDAAGKGSTIKRFMEHLNPRVARVVALVKPTETEREQWYFQRYVRHLPTAGEMVFFDRSWYNRAGVERVMGFCSTEEYDEFVRQAPLFEEMLVRSGIDVLKFYLSVSREEQQTRFNERADNPLKQWKYSTIDQAAQERWDDYTQAKEDTFKLTDSEFAPWIIVKAEDKMRARLEAMRHVLQQFEYADKDLNVAKPPDPLILSPVSALPSFKED